MSTAERWGSLTILGGYTIRGAKRRTYWLAACDCGRVVRVLKANVCRGNTTHCDDQKAHPRKRWSKEISYPGMHVRLRREHGKAANYECADCGQRAAEWSYIGGDPGELTGLNNGKRTAKYSLKMRYYTPRCIRCHRAFDGWRPS